VPSKAKAKSYRDETQVAALFTRWWGEQFLRVPGSGSVRWGGIAWEYGDVLPPVGFPGVIESKHQEKGAADALETVLRGLKPSKDNVLGWWAQVYGDCLRCYQDTGHWMQPILIYKQSRVTRRLVLEADFFTALGGRYLEIPSVWISLPGHTPFVIVDLKVFMAVIDRETFLEASRKVIPTFLVEWAT